MKTSPKHPIRRSRSEVVDPAGGAEFRYIETSTLLAAILEGDAAAGQAIRGEGDRVASALTFAEAGRVIVYGQARGRFTPDEARNAFRRLRRFEQRCQVVAISDEVLERIKRPFAVEPVRTLDAIHLATAELIEESPSLVTIVTRDRRIRDNALAMGFVVE